MSHHHTVCLICALALGCSSSEPSAPDVSPPPTAAALDSPRYVPAKDPECSLQEVTVTRIVPTVWLLVDGSGSMQEALSPFDSATRWDALRSSLMDPDTGIVKSLEEGVRWGLIAYDGPLPDGTDPTPTMECPRLVVAEPSLDNFAALDEAYPAAPLGGSTPTDKALEALIERLPAVSSDDEPTLVILATDGQPNDYCSNVPAQEIREKVVSDVKELAGAGHGIYVISLAGEDEALNTHLADVVKAADTGLPLFIPDDTSDLEDTLRTLIGPPVQCEILLASNIVPGEECQARVQLNGNALDCNTDDGWRLKEPNLIEIVGEACKAYKHDTSATLKAEVPCNILENP